MRVEHVEIVVSATHPNRSDLEIAITGHGHARSGEAIRHGQRDAEGLVSVDRDDHLVALVLGEDLATRWHVFVAGDD